MHLIAFDIDGTLIDSDEFDSELFVQAVQAVLGIDIDDNWSVYRHVTDGGIMQIAEQRALRGRRASRRTYFEQRALRGRRASRNLFRRRNLGSEGQFGAGIRFHRHRRKGRALRPVS